MSLEIGQVAPEFESIDQDGNTVKLSDFKGKKVVLYFYPKDMTPGCTAQACDLRDNYEKLQSEGYVILGVSTDAAERHLRFIAKHELPFPLLADVDHKLHDLYGTWQLKKTFGKEYMGTVRTTFIINEEGNLTDIIKKVKTKEHTKQIIG